MTEMENDHSMRTALGQTPLAVKEAAAEAPASGLAEGGRSEHRDGIKRRQSLRREFSMNHGEIPRDQLTPVQLLWLTLEDPQFSRLAYWYANLQMATIVVSTISFCLETEFNCDMKEHWAGVTDDNCKNWEDAWLNMERVCVAVFSLDFALRLVRVAPCRRTGARAVASRAAACPARAVASRAAACPHAPPRARRRRRPTIAPSSAARSTG